jgi:predicted nucleotidyltransferase
VSALLLLESKKPSVTSLCREFGVIRLRVFGSALSDTWSPSESDIDFAADFERVEGLNAFDQVLGFKVELEAILQARVDLVDLRLSKNPFFKQNVESQAKTVYAA